MGFNQIEQLVDDLRSYAKNLNAVGDGNSTLCKMITDASDTIERLLSKEKFHSFIWNTLGMHTMNQLIEMYSEREEMEGEENG